jgi:competence protein ComEA
MMEKTHSDLRMARFPSGTDNQKGARNHPKTAERKVAKMNFLRHQHVPTILLLAAFAGCTQRQNSQDLKEKTAQATAEVKSDAKAVAEGIREGWSRDKPLDLNTATKHQLLSLPGVTSAEADRVIAGRPYSEAGEVVTRGILPKAEYDKIADQVTAKK